MDTSLFDYDLPPEAIAQRPADRRDQSRLLHMNRAGQTIGHHRFCELPDMLRSGDLLVLNDTQVIPARFWLQRATGARIEALFVRAMSEGQWEMMIRGRGRVREGELLLVDGAESQQVRLVASHGEGLWTVAPEPVCDPLELLERVGQAPLPPYIQRKAPDERLTSEDRQRYQTVYAREPGAVAAPTAGLHFTEEVFEALKQKDITTTTVTLHVGLGTFKPVKSGRLEDHEMHSERFHLSAESAATIRGAKAEGRRVVAVGTTSVRVLETVAKAGEIFESESESRLFIYPPWEFKVVDALITNFHLPRSTLLMLISAFAGREFVLRGYREALEAGYRFYSYGDCCLID